jgi:hypothetical protein
MRATKKATEKEIQPAIPITVVPVPRYGTRAWLRYFLKQPNTKILATPVFTFDIIPLVFSAT